MASDNKWIWKNLIGAAVFVCVLLIGSAIGLKIVTRHGKTVQAPDFTNVMEWNTYLSQTQGFGSSNLPTDTSQD